MWIYLSGWFHWCEARKERRRDHELNERSGGGKGWQLRIWSRGRALGMSCRPRKLDKRLGESKLDGSWFLHDECPLGKLEKPSSSLALSFCLQIVEDTRRIAFRTPSKPPKRLLS